MTRGRDDRGTRFRKISVAIWSDDKFPFLPVDQKLVWFHLLTTPFSTPFGMFKVSVAALADEIRWPAERYGKAFAALAEAGFCEYDEHYLVLRLGRFLAYNPPANPKVVIGWGRIFAEIPWCVPKAAFHADLAARCDDLGPAFAEAFEATFERPGDTLSETALARARPGASGNDIDDTADDTDQHDSEKPSKINGADTVSPGISKEYRLIGAGAGAGAEVPPRRPPQEKPRPKPKISRRLAEDFTVPADWIAAGGEARSRHDLALIDLDLEAEKFENHWISNTGRNSAKRDWRRAFVNWCLKAEQRRGNGPDTDGLPTAGPPDPDPTDWALDSRSIYRGNKGSDIFIFDVPGRGIVEVPQQRPGHPRPKR